MATVKQVIAGHNTNSMFFYEENNAKKNLKKLLKTIKDLVVMRGGDSRQIKNLEGMLFSFDFAKKMIEKEKADLSNYSLQDDMTNHIYPHHYLKITQAKYK